MIQFEQYFSNGLKPPTRSPLVSNGKDFLFAIGDEVKDIKIVWQVGRQQMILLMEEIPNNHLLDVSQTL